MLTRIDTKNFFIFEDFSIHFEEGLTTLTGETGSGKSMILNSMGLVMGESFQYNLVKDKDQPTRIRMVFDIHHNSAARQWLNQHRYHGSKEGVVEIIREARYKKSSRALINGIVVELSQLKELSTLVLEIHSQKKYNRLLGGRAQLAALDSFANNAELLTKLQTQTDELCQTRAFLQKLDNAKPESLNLLRYQLREFDQLDPQEGEWESLQAKHKQLSDYDSYLTSLISLDQLLSEANPSITDQLNQAVQISQSLIDKDPRANEVNEMLNRALIDVQEADHSLRSLRDSGIETENRAEVLLKIDERLSTMFDLARKHKCEPTELPQFYRNLADELHRFEHSAANRKELLARQDKQRQRWDKTAEELSGKRRQAAKAFERSVCQYLAQLNMKYADFRVEFERRAMDEFHPTGREKSSFVISTTPSGPCEPINKISSGGEISRIGLAIRLSAGSGDGEAISTLVFDEIDTGIGGESAGRLGLLLKKLGKDQQILCVTHLAAVAACAGRHLHVQSLGKSRLARLRTLDKNQRIAELARMLTGDLNSKTSLAAAQELLAVQTGG